MLCSNYHINQKPMNLQEFKPSCSLLHDRKILIISAPSSFMASAKPNKRNRCSITFSIVNGYEFVKVHQISVSLLTSCLLRLLPPTMFMFIFSMVMSKVFWLALLLLLFCGCGKILSNDYFY